MIEEETSVMETETKPTGYVPKGRRGLTGNKAAETAVQVAPTAGNGQAVGGGASAPMGTQTETQTQLANRIFRERVERIADAEVTIYAGDNEWEPLFLVVVPELDSKAARQVYKLRGDLLRKYTKAILNVEARGKREQGEGKEDSPFLLS